MMCGPKMLIPTSNHRENVSPIVGEALVKLIIDEKTDHCKLKINVDGQELVFYLKRIAQDRLAKSLDISQVCIFSSPKLRYHLKNILMQIKYCS